MEATDVTTIVLSWHRQHGQIEKDILQGTLTLLTLDGKGKMHVLRIEEGSLYPALHRMEQDGWVRAEWGTTEKNRQARFYSLTAAGRKQLAGFASRLTENKLAADERR